MRDAVFALPRRNGWGGKSYRLRRRPPNNAVVPGGAPMNTATTCPDDDDGDGALSLPTQWKKEEGGKRKRKRPFSPSAPPSFFLLRLKTIFPSTPRPPTKAGKNKIRPWPRKRKNTFLLLPMRIKKFTLPFSSSPSSCLPCGGCNNFCCFPSPAPILTYIPMSHLDLGKTAR